MNDTVLAFLAVVSAVTVICILIDYKRYIIKSLADQEDRLNYYDKMFRRTDESLRCLTAEIDYHLHDGVHDCICDAAREWRDGDIYNSYFSSRGVSIPGMTEKKTMLPPGIYCRYCHMRLPPTDLTCSHCGAQVIDISATRIWSGK
jgi:hypothetical protein